MLLLLIQYFCKFKCRIFYVNVKLTVPFTDYLGVQFKEKIKPCTVIELTYQERIRISDTSEVFNVSYLDFCS